MVIDLDQVESCKPELAAELISTSPLSDDRLPHPTTRRRSGSFSAEATIE